MFLAMFELIKNLAILFPEKLQGFHRTLLYHCYTLSSSAYPEIQKYRKDSRICLLQADFKAFQIHPSFTLLAWPAIFPIPYSSIPGHEHHLNDPASVFVSTY